MPNSLPPERALFDGARYYADRAAGRTLRRIVLVLDDGCKRCFDCPASDPDAAPPLAGWSVRGAEVLHDGRPVRVAGRTGDVLRALASATGPVTPEDLKCTVWDRHTDDKTVHNVVSRLRQILRDELKLPPEFDPSPLTPDGYRLAAV